MNATANALPAAKAPANAFRRFTMLLRREYWEHRGGFLWTPLIAGAVSLLLTAVFFVIAIVGMRNSDSDTEFHLDDGSTMSLNGLDLGVLAKQLSAEDKVQLASGIDLTMLLSSAWPFIVMVFVMFFYCLGALYDERKDRSVLFWKSLPLSDGATVLSKVASAILVAPLLATIASILTMFGFLVMVSLVVMFYGGNPIELLWGPASPVVLSLQYLAAIPLYALWALPTVGWLLLCSAWARSKPFLWAIVLPLLAGILVAWLEFLGVFDDATWPFFRNIVLRALTSIFPMTFMDIDYLQNVDFDVPGTVRSLMSPAGVYSNLASLDLWGGVVAGAAMIFAAIRLRRWRDEG